MRSALIAAALTRIAALAAGLYHLRAVDSWADRLREAYTDELIARWCKPR